MTIIKPETAEPALIAISSDDAEWEAKKRQQTENFWIKIFFRNKFVINKLGKICYFPRVLVRRILTFDSDSSSVI